MPSTRLKSLALALPLLFLVGCGDDWVAVPYKGFPYDGARTAGSGVEYVRASMLKERGPVIESVKETTTIVTPPPAPPMPAPSMSESPVAKKAEEMFNKSQRK